MTSAILWEGDTWPLRDHQAEEDDQKIITITTTTTTTNTTTTNYKLPADDHQAQDDDGEREVWAVDWRCWCIVVVGDAVTAFKSQFDFNC